MRIVKLITIMILIVFAMQTINAQAKSTKAKSKTPTKTAPVVEQTYTPPIPVKDGVFIHISSGSENPLKVLMALTRALKMADAYDVFILFDINGPRNVLTKSQSLEYKNFEPSKILIKKLLEKNVQIEVCQMCLEAMNYTQFDLMNGIKIAKNDDFFKFTSGRILTLDY